MKSMNQLAFWKCPTIVSVHTLCLQPFQVVMDCGQTTLERFLQENTRSELTVHHLLSVADQISQALLYLVRCGYTS